MAGVVIDNGDQSIDNSLVDRPGVARPDEKSANPERVPGKRPDLILVDHKHTLVLDVAVVHPAAESHAGSSARRPGSAANYYARHKITKYGQWVRDTYEEGDFPAGNTRVFRYLFR